MTLATSLLEMPGQSVEDLMTIPTTMRAMLLTGHGGPEVLRMDEAYPVPVPGPMDVLIRIAAAGVNNTDINTRVGWYSKGDNDADDAAWNGAALKFPRIQGIDACGHIVAVGDQVPTSRVGERVLVEPCLWFANGTKLDQPWFLGSECDGAFAQYLRVDARHAHAIRSDLSDIELASFPCSYSTAENMLSRVAVEPTDTVLVTGASGGVGSAAVQLAKARGAKVIALTSPARADDLRALGADETLDRNHDVQQALGHNAVNVVIDLVAGPQWPKLLDALRPGGRYAVAGAVAGPLVELDVRTLYLKDLSFFGCTALDEGVFTNLIGRIERGEIKPLVAATFPLDQINDAQEAFAAKGYLGKIVLTVD